MYMIALQCQLVDLEIQPLWPTGLAETAILNCSANDRRYIALYLYDEDLAVQNFRRVQNHLFEKLDLMQFLAQQPPTMKICVR